MEHHKIIIQETIPFTTQVKLFERHTKNDDIIFDIQEHPDRPLQREVKTISILARQHGHKLTASEAISLYKGQELTITVLSEKLNQPYDVTIAAKSIKSVKSIGHLCKLHYFR